MCSENEKRSEILMKLFEVAWLNFDRRRTYEWKISLAIWTAIAAFIALYLKGEIPKIPNDAHSSLYYAAWLVVVVQGVYLVFVKLANGVDQAKAIFLEDLLNDISGASTDTRIAKIAEARRKIVWAKGYWSTLCEVAITIILLFCAQHIIS